MDASQDDAALQGGGDGGRLVEADPDDEEAGERPRDEPAGAGERGPEAGDEAVHVGVVGVAGVDGLVQRVHDAGDLLAADADAVEAEGRRHEVDGVAEVDTDHVGGAELEAIV